MPSTAPIEWTDVSVILFLEDSKTTPGSAKLSEKQWLDLGRFTLPETNIAHENPIFPSKYHQHGGFSWAMLVSGRVGEMMDIS